MQGKCTVSISSMLGIYCLGLSFIAHALFAGISCVLKSQSLTLMCLVEEVIEEGGGGRAKWMGRQRGRWRGIGGVRVDM